MLVHQSAMCAINILYKGAISYFYMLSTSQSTVFVLIYHWRCQDLPVKYQKVKHMSLLVKVSMSVRCSVMLHYRTCHP